MVLPSTIIYPGTFDPFTYGHLDLVTRASPLYKQIIVAIASNVNKTPLFTLAQRIAMGQDMFAHLSNVQVKSVPGLLIHFMQEQNINLILRGIRTTDDVTSEFQLAEMNQIMQADVETIFLKSN